MGNVDFSSGNGKASAAVGLQSPSLQTQTSSNGQALGDTAQLFRDTAEALALLFVCTVVQPQTKKSWSCFGEKNGRTASTGQVGGGPRLRENLRCRTSGVVALCSSAASRTRG